VSIINLSVYQQTEQQTEQQLNNNWTTTEQQLDTNKNEKNDNNEKKVYKKKFIKPTIEEIKTYCLERKNNIDADRFYDSNEAKGWLVGKTKTPMSDWKAVIRTWEKNANDSKPKEIKSIIKELK
jgi:hypothetical protein